MQQCIGYILETFKARPALVTIATDYRDFFGTTGSDLEGGMRLTD